jgi:transcriptional regulator with XRE-family HTH domain
MIWLIVIFQGAMMDNLDEPKVGKTIRLLRENRKLSLRDLSTMSGLSINAISKIERGENSPTVASLHKLASALEVQITELFRQEIHQFAVFVKSEDSTTLKSNGFTIETLGTGLSNQQLEPFKMIVAPYTGNIAEPVSHAGEEFIYCLSGKLEYFIGTEIFILEPGDRLLFKASQPHCWRNLGDEPAEVILVLETDRRKPLPHKIH